MARWIVIDGEEDDMHVLLTDGTWITLAHYSRCPGPAVHVCATRAAARAVMATWPPCRRDAFRALRVTP